MKIKEEIQKLDFYSCKMEGRVQFWFNKKEISDLFLEIHNYIGILNQRHNQYQLTYNFSWHYNSADLFWSRPFTNEEKLKVKELRREHKKGMEDIQREQAIKLAKKYKLIK